MYTKLVEIQKELKAPKNQTNTFGKYNYRSAEDILEAVKPLLAKHGLALVISDDIVDTGGRVYVKATAALVSADSITAKSDGTKIITATAFAREPDSKKGFDEMQITGAASSYARKYALNGLFAIDDTKDADYYDNSKQEPKKDQKINETGVKVIRDLMLKTNTDSEKMCEYYGVKTISDLTEQQAVHCINALQKKIK